MKRILFVLLLFSSIAQAQTPSGYTRVNQKYEWYGGKFISELGVPVRDTSTAPKFIGEIIYNDDDSLCYIGIATSGNKWKQIGITPGSLGVTSVNVSASGALGATGGPVTSTGTITLAWQGSAAQYVRGNGVLANLETDVQGIGDARYIQLDGDIPSHSHVASDISNLTTTVRNLFSAGSGLEYDAATGVFSYPGSGTEITSINGLTAAIQTFTGENISISSVGSGHTFTIDTTTLLSTKAHTQHIADSLGALMGVGEVSTAQLADSIDNRITSIYRRSDSVFYAVYGAETFAFIDSVGAGGGGGSDGNNYPTVLDFSTTTGDLTLQRDGLSTLTKNLDGRYALQADVCSGLLPGTGIVTWSGSGLIFDVTAGTYCIDGVRYTSAAGQITLDAADGTNPRFDVIALDNTGSIVKITGTAAANPAEPQIDPATQVYLTSVLVAAGATTPTQVSSVTVYDENTEWTTGTSGTISANFDNATNVTSGSKSISVASWSSGGTLTFTNSSTLQASNYSAFKFYLRLNSSLNNNQNISVRFYNGTSAVSQSVTASFTKSLTGVYQQISIPFTSFAFTGPVFDKVQISFTGSTSSLYIDLATIQGGVSNSGGSSGLQNAYTAITDGTTTATASGATSLKIRSANNKLTATVTNNDATHGDNVLLTINEGNFTGIPQSAVTSLTTDLAGKQATLVSGTNIKTVNGTSLLGSGDVITKQAQSKAVTIESPTTSENIGLFYTDVAITITKLADVLRGTSPSVTYQINHATDRSSGSPNTLFSSSRVSTSTTGATTTSFNDATIPAGSWVWLTTSANSGTVAEINITLTYTID
jgi:hypothetical protein